MGLAQQPKPATDEPTRAAHLLSVMTGPDRGTIWTMDGHEIRIGRNMQSASHVLSDPSVSRVHCRIARLDDDYMIEDVQSGNGTVLNGTRITGPTRLRQGDLIMLGSTVIRYQCVGKGFDLSREGATSSTTVTLSDLQMMTRNQLSVAMESPNQSVASIAHALEQSNWAVSQAISSQDYVKRLLHCLLSHLGTASRLAMVRLSPDRTAAPELQALCRDRAVPPLGAQDLSLECLAQPPMEAHVAPGDDGSACVFTLNARRRDQVIWFLMVPVVWQNRVVAILYCDGIGAQQRISNADALMALTVVIGHASRLADFNAP